MVEVVEASSSSSSSTTSYHKYDVFLSFRGADTRLSFTNHLHTALVNSNLATFLDNEEIRTGEFLKPEIEAAIKASRASVIVLSKNYASSTWCLDELVLILEQKRNYNQIVIPVFFHVEPAHVRKQESSFGEAMENQKRKMEAETNMEKKSQLSEKMEIWKNALTEVSDLKGVDAEGRLENELIGEIIRDIYNILRVPLGSTTLPLLIGMENHIKDITLWLKDGSLHTVDILSIWGMSGIGKTSLARYVYELHRREYTSSFVRDISRRCSGEYKGLLNVQKQLCEDVSKASSIQVYDVSEYTSTIEIALSRSKVLLVLDDVDTLDQLDALLGKKGFYPGSKIIVTTKDTSLIERCALFKTIFKPKHMKFTLQSLSDHISMKLLCQHAFMCNHPNKGYEEVSKNLARYCEGLPLALEVLGKSLYNRDVDEWEDAIELLKKEPHSSINNILHMSFRSLPTKNDQELFTHIACFFVGEDRDLTLTILKACDINTRSGITNLIDRCLLGVSDDKLMMHQLVQEMGRNLVRQESHDKPWKRSRLWSHEESFKVLKQKKGTGKLLGLVLDMRMLSESFQLKTDALCKMDNLKLLQLNYVKMNGSYKDISQELRWLCMHGFHFKSIPSELPMVNLVVLDMSHSNIESFDMSCSSSQQSVKRLKGSSGSRSKEKRLLGSLKILDLKFCEQLHSLGGFFELPALEKLIITNCTSLIHVSTSIEHCVKLVSIDLTNCKKLEKLLGTIGKLKKLETLLSNGCDLLVFPPELKKLDSLKILMADKTDKNLPTSSSAIVEVIQRDTRSLMSYLPISLVRLSVRNNNLSNESFPADFSRLSVLKKLYLDGNPIVSMPDGVSKLPSLEILSMKECTMLKTVTHPPHTLTNLYISNSSLGPNKKNSLSQILFRPNMSKLSMDMSLVCLGHSSFEIEGMVKIQPIADVQIKVLRRLDWAYLGSIQHQKQKMPHIFCGASESHVQMYYEFGIFSTFYWGEEIPNWISHKSQGSSISFTIPYSSPKKLIRGLNICSVQKLQVLNMDFCVPLTVVSNITKNLTWIYHHYISDVNAVEKSMMFLSHWMFGENEMEDGDQLIISIAKKHIGCYCMEAIECGIGVVYDEDEKNEDEEKEEEEDVLGYYKSWNHIIGGDLSHFQLTTGEYILHNRCFFSIYSAVDVANYLPSVESGVNNKGGTTQQQAFGNCNFKATWGWYEQVINT